MPIHGHTKIELTSQTTGEVETIEKDNIVTNAVSQIFNAFNGYGPPAGGQRNGEYGSTSDKSWELPESLYGGILLYDTALGSDPDTLFAPPEANLVGSGVPKVLNNGKGLQRGSFNTTESKTDLKNGVVTFVYDFATSQANGTIASVCLTSRYGGFFGESETALPAADGSNTSSYYNSALFGQETIFPNAPGKNDRPLRPPAVRRPGKRRDGVGAISNNKLVLRYATALTTEIDLFNPINTTRVKKTEERDLSDFLQVDHFSYSAVSYDVDADKICVVSTPGADQLKTTGLIRVRTYDRKTLEEKTYAFTNPTGVTLAGNVGGTSPGLRNTGRLLGGCLFMAGYTTSPSANAVPFFKIPLADPSNVTAHHHPRSADAHVPGYARRAHLLYGQQVHGLRHRAEHRHQRDARHRGLLQLRAVPLPGCARAGPARCALHGALRRQLRQQPKHRAPGHPAQLPGHHQRFGRAGAENSR